MALLGGAGLRLVPATRMLHHGTGRFFLNGEAFDSPDPDGPAFVRLAEDRRLDHAGSLQTESLKALFAWWQAGFVALT